MRTKRMIGLRKSRSYRANRVEKKKRIEFGLRSKAMLKMQKMQ